MEKLHSRKYAPDEGYQISTYKLINGVQQKYWTWVLGRRDWIYDDIFKAVIKGDSKEVEKIINKSGIRKENGDDEWIALISEFDFNHFSEAEWRRKEAIDIIKKFIRQL